MFTSFACICRRDFSQHATISEAIFSSLMASSESDTCGRKLKVRLEFPSGSQERTPPCYLPLLTCPALRTWGQGQGQEFTECKTTRREQKARASREYFPNWQSLQLRLQLTILSTQVRSYSQTNSKQLFVSSFCWQSSDSPVILSPQTLANYPLVCFMAFWLILG